VWTRCRGLPLYLWTMEGFKQVTGNVGELIEIDVATSEWERLDYAR